MDAPQRPEQSDCCNSGCSPCIFDIYEEQLKKYNERKNQCYTKETHNFVNCLSPIKYSKFKLICKKYCTQDTVLILFEFCSDKPLNAIQYKLIYNPGQYFLLKNDSYETIENKHFTRAYTPIPLKPDVSCDDASFDKQLSFIVLVKLYEKGNMSNFIRNLDINSVTKWRGPYGNFTINYNYKNILCLTQGTGIAPIFAVICAILENEDCETRLQLHMCYKDLSNILLRNEIHNLTRYWNFSYKTFLAHEDETKIEPLLKYNESVDCKKLDSEDIEKYFDSNLVDKTNTLVLICGTELFNNAMLQYLNNYEVTIHVF